MRCGGVVGGREGFGDPFPGVLALHPRAGGAAHCRAQPRVAEQRVDDRREPFGVSFRLDERGLAIDSHRRDRAGVGGDHRGEPLADRVGQAIHVARVIHCGRGRHVLEQELPARNRIADRNVHGRAQTYVVVGEQRDATRRPRFLYLYLYRAAQFPGNREAQSASDLAAPHRFGGISQANPASPYSVSAGLPRGRPSTLGAARITTGHHGLPALSAGRR